MQLLDRHILLRFLVNFLLLYGLLFLFAVTIDLILNLDHFVDAAREGVGEDASTGAVLVRLAAIIWSFHGPQMFQFYAYLHGLVAVGAMGFTLSQMYVHRELVAILAAGTSLHRVGMPFVIGIFLLSIVQLLNQELMLPRVGPLLLRGHSEVDRRGVEEFGITLTPDGAGNLLHAATFDPTAQRLRDVTILHRDGQGRTQRRTTAAAAAWDAATGAWLLEGGITQPLPDATTETSGVAPQPIARFDSDLSPHVLTMRQYREYIGMLSSAQIGDMLAAEGVADERALLRHRYARFSNVLVNLLVMMITLPSFLIREPVSLLQRSISCAGIAIATLMGAAVFMMADLRLPPLVSVFLPVLILMPVALARASMIRT